MIWNERSNLEAKGSDSSGRGKRCAQALSSHHARISLRKASILIGDNHHLARDAVGAGKIYGSGGRDRTYDQLINSQLLYR
jgi:hypothetical protein